MSLMTTWTTSRTPARRPAVPAPRDRWDGPRGAWDCDNCSLLNEGRRRRCAECGTTRD